MTPAQRAAHLRMLATLPVRTHVIKGPPATEEPQDGLPHGRVYKGCAISRQRREQIREWVAQRPHGPSRAEIAKRLGISKPAVGHHIRVIKKEQSLHAT